MLRNTGFARLTRIPRVGAQSNRKVELAGESGVVEHRPPQIQGREGIRHKRHREIPPAWTPVIGRGSLAVRRSHRRGWGIHQPHSGRGAWRIRRMSPQARTQPAGHCNHQVEDGYSRTSRRTTIWKRSASKACIVARISSLVGFAFRPRLNVVMVVLSPLRQLRPEVNDLAAHDLIRECDVRRQREIRSRKRTPLRRIRLQCQ